MSLSPLPRLRRDDSLLLVVDVQEKLVPVLHQPEALVRNCFTLAKAAALLGVPILVTEQNPTRLGPTVELLREALADSPPYSKMLFSAIIPEVKTHLEQLGKRTVLLCGCEAHVCVLQTALDLLELGYTVFIPRDAVSSRTPANLEIGWDRMRLSGAVPTSTESALFEWLVTAGTDDFRALLPLIK
jgi:nicotinamidase-related amidase